MNNPANNTANSGVVIAGFLVQQGWDLAVPHPLAGDFSPRRYARLVRADGSTALLMDADQDQKTPAFVQIAKLLQRLDISVPRILAADPSQGLVLMEDFGDRNFGRLVDEGQEATPLFRRAVEVLVHLHKKFNPSLVQDIDLPHYNFDLFYRQVSLFLEAYLPLVLGHDAPTKSCHAFREAWQQVWGVLKVIPDSLLLRDFMLDNLMDLEGQPMSAGPAGGIHSVGVLDFQDAGFGPVAYDLASLAEKVRRHDQPSRLEEVVAIYHELANPVYSVQELKDACEVLLALRHTRILGILIQMGRKGHPEKIKLLPRVRHALKTQCEQDVLKPVADWFKQYCPLDRATSSESFRA